MSGNTLAGLLVESAAGPGGSQIAVYQRRLGVWEPFTWTALCEMAERIGNGLLKKGVRPGDVVAIIADNSVEFLACQYAIVGTGGTAMLIPPDFSPTTTVALLRANNVALAIAGDQEQYDKCVDTPDPPTTVIVIETRGLRELEVAGRSDRSTRSTLGQLIDDAGATTSWHSSVASVPATSRALLVRSTGIGSRRKRGSTTASYICARISSLSTSAWRSTPT